MTDFLHSKNLTGFSIVLLGMGGDGHIASLFPDTPTPKADELVVATESPVEPKQRISLTNSTIFSAKRVYFIIKGSAKAEIIAQVFGAAERKYPAQAYLDATAKVSWFIDAEAATKL